MLDCGVLTLSVCGMLHSALLKQSLRLWSEFNQVFKHLQRKTISSPIRQTCCGEHRLKEQSDRLEGLVMYLGGEIRSEAD